MADNPRACGGVTQISSWARRADFLCVGIVAHRNHAGTVAPSHQIPELVD